MPPSDIVILSSARSGSNLLLDFIRSRHIHLALGEVFRKNGDSHKLLREMASNEVEKIKVEKFIQNNNIQNFKDMLSHLGEWAEVSEASRADVYARIMADMVEVREELRLLGGAGPDPEYKRLLARMQTGLARHGFLSSDSDNETFALNAKWQAKQLRAWQGVERRLTARRKLAPKKLSDIRAMAT